jgi:C4-dicarboxylate-specific signal transduction histidine kinase
MDELLQVKRLANLGELAACLAHELNQPLCALRNFVAAAVRQLASSSPGSREAAAETMGDAAAQAERAGAIVNKVRRLMQQRTTAAVANDLAPILDQSLRFVSHVLRKADVRPVADVDPDLPRVLVDAIQIEQVLINLVRNAVESIGEAGSEQRDLLISVHDAGGDSVTVSVCDRGAGISPANQLRLFEPFFTTKREGLGMGLSVSRSIIEAHGGRLWFEPRDGGGACFRFTLRKAT